MGKRKMEELNEVVRRLTNIAKILTELGREFSELTDFVKDVIEKESRQLQESIKELAESERKKRVVWQDEYVKFCVQKV